MDSSLKNLLKSLLGKLKKKCDETYATKISLNAKQDTLVSGSNVKTINGQSILGSGDFQISADSYTKNEIDQMIGNAMAGDY